MTKAEQVCRQFKALFRDKPWWFVRKSNAEMPAKMPDLGVLEI